MSELKFDPQEADRILMVRLAAYREHEEKKRSEKTADAPPPLSPLPTIERRVVRPGRHLINEVM